MCEGGELVREGKCAAWQQGAYRHCANGMPARHLQAGLLQSREVSCSSSLLTQPAICEPVRVALLPPPLPAEAVSGLKRLLGRLPSAVFEKSAPDRKFGLADRAGTFVKLGLEYSLGAWLLGGECVGVWCWVGDHVHGRRCTLLAWPEQRAGCKLGVCAKSSYTWPTGRPGCGPPACRPPAPASPLC